MEKPNEQPIMSEGEEDLISPEEEQLVLKSRKTIRKIRNRAHKRVLDRIKKDGRPIILTNETLDEDIRNALGPYLDDKGYPEPVITKALNGEDGYQLILEEGGGDSLMLTRKKDGKLNNFVVIERSGEMIN